MYNFVCICTGLMKGGRTVRAKRSLAFVNTQLITWINIVLFDLHNEN